MSSSSFAQLNRFKLEGRDTISLREFADLFGRTNTDYLKKTVIEPHIKFIRIGRSIYLPITEVERYLSEELAKSPAGIADKIVKSLPPANRQRKLVAAAPVAADSRPSSVGAAPCRRPSTRV